VLRAIRKVEPRRTCLAAKHWSDAHGLQTHVTQSVSKRGAHTARSTLLGTSCSDSAKGTIADPSADTIRRWPLHASDFTGTLIRRARRQATPSPPALLRLTQMIGVACLPHIRHSSRVFMYDYIGNSMSPVFSPSLKYHAKRTGLGRTLHPRTMHHRYPTSCCHMYIIDVSRHYLRSD